MLEKTFRWKWHYLSSCLWPTWCFETPHGSIPNRGTNCGSNGRTQSLGSRWIDKIRILYASRPWVWSPSYKSACSKCWSSLAYEKTGYDTTSTKRLPDCLDVWSAKRIKEQGADAVKFLLYYDVDSSDELNQQNKPTSNASVQSVWRKTFHSSLKSSLTMKKCWRWLRWIRKSKTTRLSVLWRSSQTHASTSMSWK